MLSSYRIPAWIWIVAIVVNGILLVHNIERGNEDTMPTEAVKKLLFDILKTIEGK